MNINFAAVTNDSIIHSNYFQCGWCLIATDATAMLIVCDTDVYPFATRNIAESAIWKFHNRQKNTLIFHQSQPPYWRFVRLLQWCFAMSQKMGVGRVQGGTSLTCFTHLERMERSRFSQFAAIQIHLSEHELTFHWQKKEYSAVHSFSVRVEPYHRLTWQLISIPLLNHIQSVTARSDSASVS